MNPKTITLNKDELWDALDDAVWEDDRPEKYGYRKTVVFLHANGDHYMFKVTGTRDGGIDNDGNTIAHLATKVTETVEVWVRTPE